MAIPQARAPSPPRTPPTEPPIMAALWSVLLLLDGEVEVGLGGNVKGGAMGVGRAVFGRDAVWVAVCVAVKRKDVP